MNAKKIFLVVDARTNFVKISQFRKHLTISKRTNISHSFDVDKTLNTIKKKLKTNGIISDIWEGAGTKRILEICETL